MTRYFRITQYPKNNANIVTIPFITQKEKNEHTGIVKQINIKKFGIFLNYYENPAPLVSNSLKNYIEALQPEAIGKPVGLADPNLKDMYLYWFLNLPVVDGITDNKTTLPDLARINGRKIFSICTGMRRQVYADMDMLEAMLRGGHVDFEFSEITMDN